MSRLESLWTVMAIQVCTFLDLELGAKVVVVSVALAIFGIWQAADMFLHMRFGNYWLLRWNSRLILP